MQQKCLISLTVQRIWVMDQASRDGQKVSKYCNYANSLASAVSTDQTETFLFYFLLI